MSFSLSVFECMYCVVENKTQIIKVMLFVIETQSKKTQWPITPTPTSHRLSLEPVLQTEKVKCWDASFPKILINIIELKHTAFASLIVSFIHLLSPIPVVLRKRGKPTTLSLLFWISGGRDFYFSISLYSSISKTHINKQVVQSLNMEALDGYYYSVLQRHDVDVSLSGIRAGGGRMLSLLKGSLGGQLCVWKGECLDLVFDLA